MRSRRLPGLMATVFLWMSPDVRLAAAAPAVPGEALIRQVGPEGVTMQLPTGVQGRLFRLPGDRWVLDLSPARWPTGASRLLDVGPGRRIRLGQWRPTVARLVLEGHGPTSPLWVLRSHRDGQHGTLRWSLPRGRHAVAAGKPTPGPRPSPKSAPAARQQQVVVRDPKGPDEGREEARVAPEPGVTLRRVGPLWLVRLTADRTTRYRLARRGQRQRLHVTTEGGKVPLAAPRTLADAGFDFRIETASSSADGTELVLQWPATYRYEALQTADGLSLVLGFQEPGEARDRPWRVTVDAGHGGADPGTRGYYGDAEKTLALELAQALARALEKRGALVQATRQSDQTLSLHGRVDMGEEFRSDALVSIHLNHAGKLGTHGVETYWYTPFSTMLARRVHRRLVEALRAPDRGVHRENFVVVKYGRFPACLVEVGYMSHPGEARLLKDPSYQQRAAEGMARGILEALESTRSAGRRGNGDRRQR